VVLRERSDRGPRQLQRPSWAAVPDRPHHQIAARPVPVRITLPSSSLHRNRTHQPRLSRAAPGPLRCTVRFMNDEPQRECPVLDSGRRSAEPLEHVATRARSTALGLPPSKFVEDAGSARYEDCQHCSEELPLNRHDACQHQDTEGRTPVGIGQVAPSSAVTFVRIGERTPQPARRPPVAKPTSAAEGLSAPELRLRRNRLARHVVAR